MVVPLQGARLTERLLLPFLLLLLPLGRPLSRSLALHTSSSGDVTADIRAGQRVGGGGGGGGPVSARRSVQGGLYSDDSFQYSKNDDVDNDDNTKDTMMRDAQETSVVSGTEDLQVGCRELRAKRYISDGFCTSVRPLREVVCAGSCLPIRTLPWYAEFVDLWTKARKVEWQCVDSVVRIQNVSLLCRNGEYRSYPIKVVKACRCEHAKGNRTAHKDGKTKTNKGPKRRGGRRKTGNRNRKQRRRERGEGEKQRSEKERRLEEEAEEKEGRGERESQRAKGGRDRGKGNERQPPADRDRDRQPPVQSVKGDRDLYPSGGHQSSHTAEGKGQTRS